MNKLIASGTVKEDEKIKIVASVYGAFDNEGVESEEAGSHYVTLLYKNNDADMQPANPMTFEDMILEASGDESGDAGFVVPGMYGHEDVELVAPAAVRYAKTKSFVRADGSIQVIAALRYHY